MSAIRVIDQFKDLADVDYQAIANGQVIKRLNDSIVGLSLGSAALAASGDFDSAGAAAAALSAALLLSVQRAANLSDLASISTAKSNLSLNNVENTALSTWAGSSNLTTLGTLTSGATGAGFTVALTTSTVTGILNAINGGTGQAVYAVGDLIYASTTTALSPLASVATGSVLVSGGVGVAPSYSATPTLTSLTCPTIVATSAAVGNTPLTVKGAASQTANLAEFQNSSGTAYVTVGPPTLTAGTATSNLLNVTGTVPSGSSITIGVRNDISGSGTGSGGIIGTQLVLRGGYIGSGSTFAYYAGNVSAGTGNNLNLGSAADPTGNVGGHFNAEGTTTGANLAVWGEAAGGNLNIGSTGKSITAKNSAMNIGVAGFALNTGTSPTQIGGYFGLQNATPTFASTALCADNGSTTSPIALFRDNGTTVFTIADGGNVTLTGALTITGAFAAYSAQARALDTAYQPSTTKDVVLTATVEISSGAAGDGKVELLVDSANPPTTVVATFRVGTALTVVDAPLSGVVKKGDYYKLKTTSTGGTPTFTLIGNVQETTLG